MGGQHARRRTHQHEPGGWLLAKLGGNSPDEASLIAGLKFR